LTPRVFLRSLLILVLTGGIAALLVFGRRPPAHPNILLISIDSLRSDHLHSYGYPRETSPAIDALAREGVRFATAISSSSWTLPAHITLLTSRPPEAQRGARGSTIPPDIVTLTEVLKSAGYATAGFTSGPFLSARYGFNQGFDVYDESAGKGGHSHRVVTSPELLTLATKWLVGWQQERSGAPFFMFVHMWDPHYDYVPPPPYDTLFDPDYKGDVTADNFAASKKIRPDMDPRDLAHVIALYDGEIRFTDEHLGRLIAYLRTLRVLDDTLVVVTADHGDEFFEHGGKGHATTLYDEIVRIPLVMRFPKRIAVGATVAEQVRLMDVAPTILGIAGVATPADYGNAVSSPDRERDLSTWLSGRATQPFPDLVAFSEMAIFKPIYATRRAGGKWIVATPTDAPVRHELYDLANDPGEKNNLAFSPTRPAIVNDLAASAKQWGALWQAQAKQHPTVAADLPSDHEERLRALGYVQ
jgi:arylsulfatase A-like enzyme